MARLDRIVVPGLVHHVTQRGNHRQTVFLQDNDRQVYQDLLREYTLSYSVHLAGYCLMGNHVHLVCMPECEDSLAKAIGRTHQNYSRWFQIRRRQTGHLWQNRFFSCPVDEDRFITTLLYVELNPVRAGLVDRPWEWDWSSARAHISSHDSSGLLDMGFWASRTAGIDWKQQLGEATLNRDIPKQIRTSTRCGRPWGSNEFLIALELQLGRRLQPQKQGRKPSRTPESAKA